MTRAMLHHLPKSVNRILSAAMKNCRTTVPYQTKKKKRRNVNSVLRIRRQKQ